MSMVFEGSKRVFPAGRVALQVNALLRSISHMAALRMQAWQWRHYRPECHYMRGPGPACQRRMDALELRRIAAEG